jgi:hypothetical protein
VIPPVVRQCVEFLSQPDGECVVLLMGYGIRQVIV